MALTPPNSHGAGGTAASPDVVVGNVASGATDSGNPVKIGGLVTTGIPSAQTTGKRVDAWFSRAGALVISALNAGSGGADARTVQYLPTSDGSESSVQPNAVAGYLLNGSTWDRARGNEPATLLASAARTATASSADQTNYNGRGVQIAINVTAEAGATTLTLTVQGKDSIAGTYYDLITGIVVYNAAVDTPPILRAVSIYPGVLTADAIGAGAANLISQKSVLLPRVWRATITPSDASSQTYSLSCVVI